MSTTTIMQYNRLWWLSAVFLLIKTVLSEGFKPPQVWENIKMERTIDVSSVFTSETLEVTIKNVDDDPQRQYFITFPSEVSSTIGMLTATLKFKEVFLECYLFSQSLTLDDGSQVDYGVIQLPTPLAPGKEISINIRAFYNGIATPYPEEIELGEEQFLRLQTSKVPVSPYKTLSYSLDVQGSSNIMEIGTPKSEVEAGKFEGGIMKFRELKDIEAYSKEDLDVVYNRMGPINEVTQLTRDVWFSHWGHTVQFQEYYEMTNGAVKTKGGFSRLKLMKQFQENASRLSYIAMAYEMHLPEHSTEAFFTDKVGMVSTASMKDNSFVIKPRYPVIGGWNYNFTIGWTNQLNQFVHKLTGTDNDDIFLARIPVLNGPVDTFYDNITLNIYLPEGVSVLNVDAPFGFDSVTVEHEHSYLDLNEGHARLTFHFKNFFTELGRGEVLVKYKYSPSSMYKKPLSIAAYVFVALMSFFVFKSINLRVTPKKD